MQRSRAGFTLKASLIAVALVALNLAAAVATSRHYPRKHATPHRGVAGGSFLLFDGEATRQIYDPVDIELGKPIEYRLTRVIIHPRRPSLLAIWSPILASASITLLVLLVPGIGKRARCRGTASRGAGFSKPYGAKAGRAARWGAVVLALAALNLAGVWYREPSRSCEVPYHIDATCSRYPTIVHRSDDAIVGYLAPPGELQGPPHVILPPKGTFVDRWWLALGSCAITFGVVVIVSRGRCQSAPRSSESDALHEPSSTAIRDRST